jgi:glycogen operon protein
MCAERVLPWPGASHPLGATHDPARGGTNFAVVSAAATGISLCLLDEAGVETDRLLLQECDAHVWHGFVPGVGPGDRYGFRVDGPWNPGLGDCFNPAKLLLDPYARAITGDWTGAESTYGHTRGRTEAVRDPRDSASAVPHSVIVGTDPDWTARGFRPEHHWADTVLYELHVRGFTRTHPDVPPELRGTYAGLAHPAVTDYLVNLGVTTVELLPVHQFVSEPHLLAGGRRNYWGYNTVGFFAPHCGYSASGSLGGQVTEFRTMVAALHTAGLEVILDVVYNHTAEGNEDGPTLCFRGLDNRAYYRMRSDGRYDDTTGCGNTVDVRTPQVVTLIADSLRYWVTEMGVDGFRFDLAPALLRGQNGPEPDASLLTVLAQDPVLSRVKLIAEPWDVGPGGYMLGGFPPPWAEWNDRFRGEVRDFWRAHGRGVDDLSTRLAGSSDLFNRPGRNPQASINFVTAHDGFTLADLVTYNCKHNEANGEANRDGTDDNRSWNCGVEGDTTDPSILVRRDRQIRNLLATLLLSTGVPMLTAGDERGRTQSGNNNAYCIDDPTTWLDWTGSLRGNRLIEFTRTLLRLRREHPVFRSRTFFTGTAVGADDIGDVVWFDSAGRPMTPEDWSNEHLQTLGMLLNGGAVNRRGEAGEHLRDDSFLLLLHAGETPANVTVPTPAPGWEFRPVLATSDETGRRAKRVPLPAGAITTLVPHSMAVFQVVHASN